MKKLLLTLLLIASSQFIFGQNTIAKLKFSEAEEAYAVGNYELTIAKLNEAEELLKSTNPKILYLKIVAQFDMIEKKETQSFSVIENTRELSAKYLKDYENLSNVAEKYKDIYKISVALEKFPQSKMYFDFLVESENLKKQNAENRFKDWIYYEYDGFKLGHTLEETIKLYPRYKKHAKVKGSDINGFDNMILRKGFINVKGEPEILYIKNNIIFGYRINLLLGITDDSEFSKGNKEVLNTIKEYNELFLFSPTETIEESTENGYYSKKILYTWSKNNKTITLFFNQVKSPIGGYSSIVIINLKDKNLLN